MAKANKKKKVARKPSTAEIKAPKSKPAKKEKKVKAISNTEPLETFQDPEKTGRAPKKEKKEKEKKKPARSLAMAIQKVKLNKKGFLTITSMKIESDGSTTYDSKEHDGRVIHPDLQKKFEALRVHLGLRCGYISAKQIKEIESYKEDRIAEFEVRGVSINTEEEAYVISGIKTLPESKERFSICSPLTRVGEAVEDGKGYRYREHLEKCVEELLAEVKLYETGEKVGGQGKLPFEDAGEGFEDIKEKPATTQAALDGFEPDLDYNEDKGIAREMDEIPEDDYDEDRD